MSEDRIQALEERLAGVEAEVSFLRYKRTEVLAEAKNGDMLVYDIEKDRYVPKPPPQCHHLDMSFNEEDMTLSIFMNGSCHTVNLSSLCNPAGDKGE